MAKEQHLDQPHHDRSGTPIGGADSRGGQTGLPAEGSAGKAFPAGPPRQIYDARQQRSLTRYALAQSANVPSTIIRAIEQGDDVPLSQFHAVVAALGLSIELVEQT